MKNQNNIILSKLDLIESELTYIKEHMVEKDDIMTYNEFETYKKSFNKKNLISLEEVEKELGL